MTKPGSLPVALEDIQATTALIGEHLLRTPTVPAAELSDKLRMTLSLKLENLQHTGSFKPRGALVKLAGLSEEEQRRGVIAMSAGNHAQGVAYHAARMGISATIVMPEQTPFVKVDRTRRLGANIVLHGRNISDCAEKVREIVEETGVVLIHPYDDPAIIAGQGTIGLEMLADAPDLETLVVPIGGGGLVAGIAVAAKAIKPDIRIYGVEVDSYPSMTEALAGLPPSSGGETLAEGIAVKTPGQLNQVIVKALVDDILLVSERDIERAVQLLIEGRKIVAEGAGAAGIAVLLRHGERFAGQRVGTVICGGNIDTRILGGVLMRGLVADGRLVRLRTEISDEPGVLARIAGLIGDTGGNIVEVYHQRLFQDVPVKMAEVDSVVETRNADHVSEIIRRLTEAGYPTRRLGDRSRDDPQTDARDR